MNLADRTVNVWNFIPSSVNFSTLNVFKRSIVSRLFFIFEAYYGIVLGTFIGQLLVASVSLLSRSICFVAHVTLSCFEPIN